MNNVKLLQIKCCFFQFSNSPVALKNLKKILPPRKSWNDAPASVHFSIVQEKKEQGKPMELPTRYRRDREVGKRSKAEDNSDNPPDLESKKEKKKKSIEKTTLFLFTPFFVHHAKQLD